MNDVERRECELLLIAIYNGRVTPAAAQLWMADVRHKPREDVIQGIKRLAETRHSPTLSDLLECVRAAQRDRFRRESPRVTIDRRLEANIEPREQVLRRGKVAREIARDIIEGRVPKDVDFNTELARRMKGGGGDQQG